MIRSRFIHNSASSVRNVFFFFFRNASEEYIEHNSPSQFARGLNAMSARCGRTTPPNNTTRWYCEGVRARASCSVRPPPAAPFCDLNLNSRATANHVFAGFLRACTRHPPHTCPRVPTNRRYRSKVFLRSFDGPQVSFSMPHGRRRTALTADETLFVIRLQT